MTSNKLHVHTNGNENDAYDFNVIHVQVWYNLHLLCHNCRSNQET